MDIMAMRWVEDAKPIEEMMQSLMNLFTDNKLAFRYNNEPPFKQKPHGRVVYTISIWADFYIDISIIEPQGTVKQQTITHE